MASLLLFLFIVFVQSTPPHIIVIIADDLGWATVGFHDSEVQTPFIDNLAVNESLILSRHYVYKYCSPTRCSFLSGRLPLHINEENRDVWQPGGGLHLGMYTMPQILKQSETANYKTLQFGKWHAGMSNIGYLPIHRGFDSSFGYLGGAEDHYSHRQGDGIDFWNSSQPINGFDGVYGDLVYNELAVQSIRSFESRSKNESDRLFLYMALQIVHDPQQVPAEFLDIYPADMYNRRRSMDAMASFMDDAVKNITNALKEGGIWNESILLFFADNGGATGVNSKSGNNWPLRGGKHSDFEGGVRGIAFISGGYIAEDRRGQSLGGYSCLRLVSDICVIGRRRFVAIAAISK